MTETPATRPEPTVRTYINTVWRGLPGPDTERTTSSKVTVSWDLLDDPDPARDIVLTRRYSFTGKTLRPTVLNLAVRETEDGDWRWEIRAVGKLLRKDGSVGETRTDTEYRQPFGNGEYFTSDGAPPAWAWELAEPWIEKVKAALDPNGPVELIPRRSTS